MSMPSPAPAPASTMPTMAVIFGITLVALGVFAYFAPHMLGGGQAQPPAVVIINGDRYVAEGEAVRDPARPHAPTSLIPAGIGAVILLAGIASIVAPDSRKHAMHAAALASVLGSIGGMIPVMMRHNDTGEAAVMAGYLMTITSLFFLALCINSFVQARKDKEAGRVATA
ncbi:MAG: hypothetical protein K8U57_38295 [Planctomycetes bacterium]|nr:hypothetical protein [Planctomycetota bacterium]